MKDETNPSTQPSSATDGEPQAGSPSASGPGRASPRRRRGGDRRLVETAGPEPSTPIEEVRLTVGRLAGSHGVSGEMKMRLLTDDPENLLDVETVYLGDRDDPIALESIRLVNDGALVRLGGTESPEDAARLSGLAVKIAGSDARPLEEGEYFLFQLIGLEAFDEDGTRLGTVVDLIETGAHDVLVIGKRPDGGDDLLVPNHPDFAPEVSPETGRIVVRPPQF